MDCPDLIAAFEAERTRKEAEKKNGTYTCSFLYTLQCEAFDMHLRHMLHAAALVKVVKIFFIFVPYFCVYFVWRIFDWRHPIQFWHIFFENFNFSFPYRTFLLSVYVAHPTDRQTTQEIQFPLRIQQ